jgi:hypothetical protein
MATVTANLGAQRPLRLVGGRWKRWSARVRTVLAASPLLVLAAVVAVSAVRVGVVCVPLALGCLLVPADRIRRRLAAVWWRCRWSWDARAGGLARVAELGVEQDQDYRPQATECVPVLARLDVHPHGRSYTVRPLPGQSIADLEMAAPLLAVRWKASQVTVRPASRPGRFVLDVTIGDVVAKPAPIPVDVLPAGRSS